MQDPERDFLTEEATRFYHQITIDMKIKHLAIVGAVCAITISASAQSVTFFTPNATFTNPIFDIDGTTKAEGPKTVAQVYWGTSSDFSAMMAIGSPVALRDGAAAGAVTSGAVPVTGASFNQSIFYSIVAWNTTSGMTYELATEKGNSTPVALTLGADAIATPPNVNTFDSFQLQNVEVVPEPSTVALGIIGGLALLMRRRRS